MKALIFFLGLVTYALAYTSDMSLRLNEDAPDPRHLLLVKNEKGATRVMNLKDTRLEKKATLADLVYYFYTRANKNNPIVITNNKVETLGTSRHFSPEKQTVFIIHGWDNDHNSPVNTLITEALLETFDVNVFVADWSNLAMKNYFTAKLSVKRIGNYIGEFVNSIVGKYKMSYKNFTFIGHSLGAHVAGAAGSTVKEKIDHIVGLDPAQPLFSLSNLKERLDPGDADFVQIIHTSGGRLGFLSPLGHADYYPNGGSSQPGCFLDLVGSCAHSRSYQYYADSIKEKDRTFWAFKCKSYKQFNKGDCLEHDNLSIMGRLEVDKKANGNYYLKTKSKEPYAESLLLKLS